VICPTRDVPVRQEFDSKGDANEAAVTAALVKEGRMGFVGVIITFVGFLVAAASVGITSSNGGRLGIVLIGIVISLFGIMGVLNPAYQKNAVWKK
jgi:predicted RND superfamily exporter protein